MVDRKKVAVIGGGVSGLAAAKAFDERGHRVCGFERSHDFGGVWELSRSYPDVQTQSPKDLYCYTDHPMPQDYPEWPKGPQVHAYLHSYAQKHNTARLFRLNTTVKTMERRADGRPGWTLTLEAGAQTWSEDFDFVSVCTGQFSEKNIISHPGQDDFVARGGEVMHSSEYTDPSVCAGKDVVVLGGSKSATDIAVNAAKNGARSVRLVYLENVWRVPYFVGGINFKRLLFMRAQEQQFNQWGKSPLQRVIAAVLKPLVWVNFRGLETLLKTQLKLKKHNMVPKVPIEKDVSCSIPIVTPGLIECLDKGQITPVLGTFDSYSKAGLKLSTGDTVPCDVAILAVGWKLGVPYLPQEFQEKLIEDDGQYRVYRLSVNPDLPDMGFVGFNSSFCTVLSAEMIANWLVRFADGKLSNQPSAGEMNQNIEMMLNWKRNERPAAKIYGGLCSAPFHFKHFDELLADMGATKKKRDNPLAEQFSYPNAAAFGSYLASTEQYQAG
ncbi:NAD(P)/FAD-dependent oxidoreductase [Sulfitobacter sp. M57]|uniref:flavin-containing monooxygenase n=1 Tax=unclassified Sulfitobacter TaxID=196795 RepID=UPI0023E1D1D6|nr:MULTISPECIES: NAD(P)/FAD-dependent oxidoreductase [unclassified Sulfitobacter]MDF3415864.1 NAD(P)/FAD-dependent oxidoreductase [Sulfitobacter sp. KE5]MDF3423344.1 NAD(P)/FAD-dependent oxidoreductase [Sulfitobacter sp. KE43]MDF3434410.1 NAD(P)/FAD-dependent oxidoreductase [Sulfitobacter sp. KE42]MDF3460050.1 NAD(P)/FAD-dependent oxidoreductase [Sulfitobacter sp. S74]MDF3463948.1 NAD(P)/FAD-dependent oxidoreductase [Sulfitobacter sp. Ks18]